MGVYKIQFTNVEGADIEANIQDLDEAPSGGLEGGENPCILETVDSDDNVTKPIISRRLTVVFNSQIFSPTYGPDVETFSDGDDDRYRASIDITTIGGILADQLSPFIGELVLDDNQEAFQPKPNPVQLRAGEGLGSLRDIPLRESDGDIPVGHYRITDYIYLCLLNLFNIGSILPDLHVAMNLYETDTDPDTSHAFFDTFLDARTFETDVNERDSCFTVLEKILDAFGCFMTYHTGGWYIIRWDEYDRIGASVTSLRFANFTDNGDFYELVDYETVNVDKIIAHDSTAEYEGYRLSNDNAVRRFQRMAKSVTHEYRYEQPSEIPCNSDFLRGTLRAESPEDETYNNYDIECWTLYKGPPNVANDGDAYIRVNYDAIGNEEERYVVLEVQPTSLQYYLESERIPIGEGDKFSIWVDIRHDGQVETASGGGNYNVMQVRLYADDNTYYTLDPQDQVTSFSSWVESNSTWSINNRYFKRFYDGEQDDTDWSQVGIDLEYVPKIPKSGYITICLHQTKKSDEFQTHFQNLRFDYVPLIAGTYRRASGHSHKVTGQNDSRKNITHEMFIGDSPKAIFKGALKKFDGVNYILTETWNYYNDPTVLPDSLLGKHIVFQWWNQYRKTRTVIETDIQGLNSTEEGGIPSVIHRWKILHGGQDDKKFRLPSFKGMDFYKCGWNGVFVETSEVDGDRVYSGAENAFSFKYIQE